MKTEEIVLIGLAALAVMLYMRKKSTGQAIATNSTAQATGVQTATTDAVSSIIDSAGNAVSDFLDGL